MNYIYRLHAIERMFERDISEDDVESVVKNGKVLETYINDKPYASYLCLGFVDDRVIHVVYSKDQENSIIIITVYEPNITKWEADFTQRIK